MSDKRTYFTILFIAFFCLFLCFISKADEIGISPDPYDTIWETATEEDIECLAKVVYLESARCECPYTTNVAVVETVLNRVLSDGFRDTISGVCKQKGQFYYRESAKPDSASYEAIEYVKKYGRTVLPDYGYCYFATKKQTLGKDHIWVGGRTASGKPRKGKGMYFCRGREEK